MYLNWPIMVLLSSNSDYTAPTKYEKIAHEAIRHTIITILSDSVVGHISPYPIVAIVVSAKYAEIKYASSGV